MWKTIIIVVIVFGECRVVCCVRVLEWERAVRHWNICVAFAHSSAKLYYNNGSYMHVDDMCRFSILTC